MIFIMLRDPKSEMTSWDKEVSWLHAIIMATMVFEGHLLRIFKMQHHAKCILICFFIVGELSLCRLNEGEKLPILNCWVFDSFKESRNRSTVKITSPFSEKKNFFYNLDLTENWVHTSKSLWIRIPNSGLRIGRIIFIVWEIEFIY